MLFLVLGKRLTWVRKCVRYVGSEKAKSHWYQNMVRIFFSTTESLCVRMLSLQPLLITLFSNDMNLFVFVSVDCEKKNGAWK